MTSSARTPAPWLLALDAATERMALALVKAEPASETAPAALADGHATIATDPEGRLFLHEEEGGARASLRLLPAAESLLVQAGLRWKDLAAVGFGRGPGAFTGLRTACAAAQGLALGSGCAVLPLDSLLLVAEDARLQCTAPDAVGLALPASDGFLVQVAMDARMGEIYAATYRCTSTGAAAAAWYCLAAPCLCTPGELIERLEALESGAASTANSGTRLLAGSALQAGLAPLHRPGWTTVAREASRSRALAHLLQQAWADGPRLDAAQAMPVYVRDRVAMTTAEREASVKPEPA